MDAHLSKPIPSLQLFAAIERLLANVSGTAETLENMTHQP
jgi:hypothetical protein